MPTRPSHLPRTKLSTQSFPALKQVLAKRKKHIQPPSLRSSCLSALTWHCVCSKRYSIARAPQHSQPSSNRTSLRLIPSIGCSQSLPLCPSPCTLKKNQSYCTWSRFGLFQPWTSPHLSGYGQKNSSTRQQTRSPNATKGNGDSFASVWKCAG
jgi:hypothetical protein